METVTNPCDASSQPTTGVPGAAVAYLPSVSSQGAEFACLRGSSAALPSAAEQAMQQQLQLHPAATPLQGMQQPSASPLPPSTSTPHAQHQGGLQDDTQRVAQLMSQLHLHQRESQHTSPAPMVEAPQAVDGPATLFFAKVPRTASEASLHALFESFGKVLSLELFAPYVGSTSSKGCGLVTMCSSSDAAAVIAGLKNYTWEGMRSAMVVKLMSAQRQHHSLQGSRVPQVPQQTSGSQIGNAGVADVQGSSSSSGHTSRHQHVLPGSFQTPPLGCAQDAYKLFVGNLPRAHTEADLLPIFESIGPVEELVILRDRNTQQSQGSAFVWYATAADADKAQATFNMQLVLQQPSGAHSRPLVVRRAVHSKRIHHIVIPPSEQPGAVAGIPAEVVQSSYVTAGPSRAVESPVNPSLQPLPIAAARDRLAYAQTGLQVSSGMPMIPVFFNPQGGSIAVMPAPAYLLSPQQQQQQQGIALQPDWQGQSPAVAQGQATHIRPFNPSAFVSTAEAASIPSSQVLQYPSGSWHPSQGYALQPPAYGAACSNVTPVHAGPNQGSVEQQQQQQQQPPAALSQFVVTSLPQATPPAQVAAGAVGQPHPGLLSPSSVTPNRSMLLTAAPAGDQSNYVWHMSGVQQVVGPPHRVTIQLTSDQYVRISSELANIASMSNTSMHTQHNAACGVLELTITAASTEELQSVWQLVHGLLSRQTVPGSWVV